MRCTVSILTVTARPWSRPMITTLPPDREPEEEELTDDE